MRKIQLLPNLITLANAFCGMLALAKAIDALAYSGSDDSVFYRKLETACLLVFLGMIFDLLDGFVARLTRSTSEFGAQLDSYADALTFGVTPALLAKVLIEHEGPLIGWPGNPRVHFLAAAAFALMAILRLVRFNLDSDPQVKQQHSIFYGLPSPGAAGAVASTIWLYLVLKRPELETSDGTPTPFGRLMGWMQGVDWRPFLDLVPALLVAMLPVLGLLMVSKVRYAHFGRLLTRDRSTFLTLVALVFGSFAFYLAPVPMLFLAFNGFVLAGPLGRVRSWVVQQARHDRAQGYGPLGVDRGRSERPQGLGRDRR
jgi:CDP-diacylglycerol--serine O-phosphatidyltransferase